MKRNTNMLLATLIVILVSLFAGPSAGAQQRLRFGGVPVSGNIMGAVNKLRTQGWNVSDAADHQITLSGTWRDFQRCLCSVYEDEAGKGVTEIELFVPCGEAWPDAEATWKHVLELYTQDYGKPAQKEERFSAGADEDGFHMFFISTKHCHYTAKWSLSGGTVSMRFVTVGDRCYVLVSHLAA